MSCKKTSSEMVATKSKNKVLSTPDYTLDSPSRDSDSLCDSETASPVPFFCTQDGTDGVTDVVWNYYTSNSRNSHPKNSTPISKKAKKPHRLKLPQKKSQPTIPKRSRLTQKKTQLPAELLELNQFVDKLMEKKKTTEVTEKTQSGSEEDIFSEDPNHSPRSIFRTKRCLRKNVLSSKFNKPESEIGIESDDSMNECLLIASQAVEENISNNVKPLVATNFKANSNLKINDDSIDLMLQSVKTPVIDKIKSNHESPGLNNDSFDSLLGNLNDSALERLSQMPVLNRTRKETDKSKTQDTSWKVEDIMAHNSPSRFSFTRYNSMPESPSVPSHSKSSSSNAISLGRYNSMPFNESKIQDTGDSPMRCTPLEIQKKRQQAREKLLAKRLLPFTQTQQSEIAMPSQTNEPVNNRCRFELKVPTVSSPKKLVAVEPKPSFRKQNAKSDGNDMKSLIEKKRQEALMKLRRRQVQK